MTKGEKAMGVFIALMGGALGASHVRQYGQRPDDSVEHIMYGGGDGSVAEILELENDDDGCSENSC